MFWKKKYIYANIYIKEKKNQTKTEVRTYVENFTAKIRIEIFSGKL